MLPVSRPSIGTEELEEIKKIFDTGWLGLGSTVYEFENKLKEYLGSKNVIAVNNGTNALHIALDAFDSSCAASLISDSKDNASTIIEGNCKIDFTNSAS